MPFETDADLVIGAVFEDDRPAALTVLHKATGGEVERAWERGEFTGKLFDVLVTPAGSGGQRAVLIGAGMRKDLTLDRVRRIAMELGPTNGELTTSAADEPKELPMPGSNPLRILKRPTGARIF